MATACLLNIDLSGLCRAQPAGDQPDANRVKAKRSKRIMYAKSHRPQSWLTGVLYLRVLYVYRHGHVHPGVTIWVFAHLSHCAQHLTGSAVHTCQCAHLAFTCTREDEGGYDWAADMSFTPTAVSLINYFKAPVVRSLPLPHLEEWLHLPTWSNPPPLATIFCLSPGIKSQCWWGHPGSAPALCCS